LKTYASPLFGSLPVAQVDTHLVMKVLESIWKAKPETASRLRGRIEAVLDWAKVRGYRSGENPARWKGHLDHLLPARRKVQKVQHHAALPYAEIGAFVADLRKREGIAARALELLIYTACRTSAILNARWEEIDFENRDWIIPGHRMKAGLEHRIPLSDQALEVLRLMRSRDDGAKEGLVFPGQKRGKPLSNMAMLTLLGRMGLDDLTAHGFRSTFRDWAAERTNFPGEVAEAALAHTVGNKVEAAYRRGDLFEKRRQLISAWAKFCRTTAPPASSRVVAMRRQ
jgi:integrase